ncbi:MAG TPA: septum site-determining protein MinD [Clostridiales bacterium]|nr:septum site-determining protein MinD [Clostridiales bacterium]
MGKLLVVTSGKGGTGKSTVAAGLSIALCSLGRKVLLIDMDQGLRCLDILLGVADTVVFDLYDVICGRKPLNAAVVRPVGVEGLDLLPAPIYREDIEKGLFERIISEALGSYDYVILDSPAGLDKSLFPAGSQALVVVNPDPVSVRSASYLNLFLEELGINPRLMVLNKFIYKYFKKGLYKNVDQIIDQTGLRLAAVIPYDEEVVVAAARGIPLQKGRAANAFFRLANRLEGNVVPLPNLKKL